MQVFLDISVLILGMTSILSGIAMGYVIGGQGSLKPLDRFLLGAISGFIGGVLVSIIVGGASSTNEPMLISVIACLIATFFGESLNWAPPPKKGPKRHVYFDPDDEEEFDREIEESLGGSETPPQG